jgi:hypothetical protein
MTTVGEKDRGSFPFDRRSLHPDRGTSFIRLAALVLAGCAALSLRVATAGAEDAGAPSSPSPVQSAETSRITAIWANDGGDKVTREDLRGRTGDRPVLNRIWDGERITLFGARNEIVGFNLTLEAADGRVDEVSVAFDALSGPDGREIRSEPAASPAGVFDWTRRPIELFFVRYLRISGLSLISYDTYDERHIAARMRRPHDEDGNGVGGWEHRPDADTHYPDIAVPIELHPRFSIEQGLSQGIWVDVAIPKDAVPGAYSGDITVSVAAEPVARIPVELEVRDITLSDRPAAGTMVFTSYNGVAARYAGEQFPAPNSEADRLARTVMQRQLMLAHRHRIALVDDNGGAGSWHNDAPRPDWIPALTGRLFTAENGYAGPGAGIGTGVYSIATYGRWRDWWTEPTREVIWRRTDGWEQWFRASAPDTERFLYLVDESDDFEQTEQWAAWMKANPGPGGSLRSFATVDLLQARASIPSLDIVASLISVADTGPWRQAVAQVRASERGQLWMYNGRRPASGSFATDDDGVALRQLAWAQWKMAVPRWFYWEATYYDDFQGGRGPTDVFTNAQTFGGPTEFDPVLGWTGWNASNGDGVLFYPGTDSVFPEQSYGLAGPIASLRLKHWRRGIQDVDYIRQATAIDPAATKAIVERMVPRVLWETGVDDPADPTWVRAPISWSIDPDDWEAARAELADIIEGQSTPPE